MKAKKITEETVVRLSVGNIIYRFPSFTEEQQIDYKGAQSFKIEKVLGTGEYSLQMVSTPFIPLSDGSISRVKTKSPAELINEQWYTEDPRSLGSDLLHS